MPSPLFQNVNVPNGIPPLVRELVTKYSRIVPPPVYLAFVEDLVELLSILTGAIISINAAPVATDKYTNDLGTLVSVMFDKNMVDPAGTESEWVVTVNGADVMITGITLDADPKVFNLAVNTVIGSTDSITVQYTEGSARAIDTTVLQSFGPVDVRNQSTIVNNRLTVPVPALAVGIGVISEPPVSSSVSLTVPVPTVTVTTTVS